jgi:serine/threonine-protein kinase
VFLEQAQQVRPIAYVRADWFTSVASQFPLYEDLLQMPSTVTALQEMLRVRPDEQDAPAADGLRAGMTVSGVSRNNRVVQRQPQRFGAFWRSYDFNSSKGTGNMFKDPINLHPNGGEMIFNLPNGLQAYFVTNAVGTRLEEAPTGIVTDKFAEDKTVRNGLSCMRCHDQGIKGFHDNLRQAIDQLPTTASRDNGIDPREVRHFYPEQKQMDRLIDSDAHRFNAAMTAVLGHKQEQEPITPVSRQFLDAPLQLHSAAAELGLPDTRRLTDFFSEHVNLGLVPLASGGVVRRDTWEDYFDQVVRGIGKSMPIVPLDGLHRGDYPAGAPPYDVTLATGKPTYASGDEVSIKVVSKYEKPLYIELVGTSADGKQVILTKYGTKVGPNDTYQLQPFKVKPGVGKEHITMYACDQPLPEGKLVRTQYGYDRVIHDFYPLQDYSRATGKSARPRFNPGRLVKRTIEIETK